MWPGCTLPKHDDVVVIPSEDELRQLPSQQLLQFASQLGLGLSGAPAREVLRTIKSAKLDEQARGQKGHK